MIQSGYQSLNDQWLLVSLMQDRFLIPLQTLAFFLKIYHKIFRRRWSYHDCLSAQFHIAFSRYDSMGWKKIYCKVLVNPYISQVLTLNHISIPSMIKVSVCVDFVDLKVKWILLALLVMFLIVWSSTCESDYLLIMYWLLNYAM